MEIFKRHGLPVPKRADDPLRLGKKSSARKVVSTIAIGALALTLVQEKARASVHQQELRLYTEVVSKKNDIHIKDVVPIATVIFLASGTSWAKPFDFNNGKNTIEVIGGGGNGGVWTGDNCSGYVPGTGGGGGGYAKYVNMTLTGSSISYAVGAGGGGTTQFNSFTVYATGGGAGGGGSGVGGTVNYVGGSGTGGFSGGIGGGAAGPMGNGSGQTADAGYGGSSGGSGTWSNGGNGNEFGGGIGCGGGGSSNAPWQVGNGGYYGGGGGAGGVGAQGLIVITYTPLKSGGFNIAMLGM